ncbi:MAG: hypothetical protein ACRDQ4_04120 [Pseudonocardiaceae bacterium]
MVRFGLAEHVADAGLRMLFAAEKVWSAVTSPAGVWEKLTVPYPRTSAVTHTHDPANRGLPQQAMRQARANNVPPAGGGGPHQGGTTVMITVSVPKVTQHVT